MLSECCSGQRKHGASSRIVRATIVSYKSSGHKSGTPQRHIHLSKLFWKHVSSATDTAAYGLLHTHCRTGELQQRLFSYLRGLLLLSREHITYRGAQDTVASRDSRGPIPCLGVALGPVPPPCFLRCWVLASAGQLLIWPDLKTH